MDGIGYWIQSDSKITQSIADAGPHRCSMFANPAGKYQQFQAIEHRCHCADSFSYRITEHLNSKMRSSIGSTKLQQSAHFAACLRNTDQAGLMVKKMIKSFTVV